MEREASLLFHQLEVSRHQTKLQGKVIFGVFWFLDSPVIDS
jgi:hypothetical protein